MANRKSHAVFHLLLAAGAMTTGAGSLFARSIFLNGIDVSSARSQELRHVQVRINERGDIFISAPHYQVTEEDFFTPLSRVDSSSSGTAAVQNRLDNAAGDVASEPVVSPGPAVAVRPPAVNKPAAVRRPTTESPADATAQGPAGGFTGTNLAVPSSYKGESMPPVIPATPPATGTSPVANSVPATQNAE